MQNTQIQSIIIKYDILFPFVFIVLGIKYLLKTIFDQSASDNMVEQILNHYRKWFA